MASSRESEHTLEQDVHPPAARPAPFGDAPIRPGYMQRVAGSNPLTIEPAPVGRIVPVADSISGATVRRVGSESVIVDPSGTTPRLTDDILR